MSPWWLDVGWLGGGRACGMDQRRNFRVIIFTGLPMWMKTLDTRHRGLPEGPVAESVSIGPSAEKLADAGEGTRVGESSLKSWVERSPSPNDARCRSGLWGTEGEKGSTSPDAFPQNPRPFHRMRSSKPSRGGGATALPVENDRKSGAIDRMRRFLPQGARGLPRRSSEAERDPPPRRAPLPGTPPSVAISPWARASSWLLAIPTEP